MSYCVNCHRPLRLPTPDGLGPKCRKTAKPIPEVERDLFGFDVPAAALAAVERLRALIEASAAGARIELRHEFAAARRRLGVCA